MGLAIKQDRDRNYPILICDASGKKIENWHDALASWGQTDNTDALVNVNIYHKMQCDPHERGSGSNSTSMCHGSCQIIIGVRNT